MKKVFIREIFLSIQGEGPYVGEQQLFIRFCGCNLNCAYCDTDFDVRKAKEYTVDELINIVNAFGKDLVLSLTGGEPLVSVAFLKEFLPLAKASGHKIYLETNGTLPNELAQVIGFVDIVSADIKLESASGQKFDYNITDEFFKVASNKVTFAKIVFDNNISDAEIDDVVSIAKKYNVELILQPKMIGIEFALPTGDCVKIFEKFHSKYKRTRLIPQIHKFLNVR